MADTLAAPHLEAALSLIRGRERRRSRDAGVRRTLTATAAAVIIVALWHVADRVLAREPMPLLVAVLLVAFVFAVGAAFVVRGVVGRTDAEIARDVDRRLHLHDRASAALAVLRGEAVTRLAGCVLADADAAVVASSARIDAAFPEKPERRVTWGVRWAWCIAGLAIVLAILSELLGRGPIRILPGFVSGPGDPHDVMPPTKDAPRRDGTKRDERGETPPAEKEKDDKTESPKDGRKEPGGVRVALKMAKDEFEADEAITATVAAAATGELTKARAFDVRVSVDGIEVDSGAELSVDPAKPSGDRTDVDLRHVPGLKLTPGEHTATARLTTRTDHEEHTSAPVKFRVLPPKDDSDGKSGDAPPKPKPKPDAPKPEPQPGDPQKKEDEPIAQGPPPPPPPSTDRKYVLPLFGDGDTVKKRGPVLVLDPGGGVDSPAERRPLGEALPGAQRRAEETVDRANLADADRDLVRRYFELLEELRK